MKKYILFPLFAVAVICFSSCHSQKGRMDDLKDFVEKIQEEGKDYLSTSGKKLTNVSRNCWIKLIPTKI